MSLKTIKQFENKTVKNFQMTSNNELLLLLDLGFLLCGEDGGQLLLLWRVVLHAAGAEPEIRQVTPDISDA